MAYFLTSSLILQLSATPDSYPFSSRFIPIQKNMSPVVLGTGGTSSSSGRQTPASPTRSCSPHISAPPDARNGWFTPAERDQSGPIPVGAQHAEILVKDGEVCIRDLESGFGTYVNGARLQSNGQPTPLRKGDVISLGHAIPRNTSTPANITNEQLKPIIAKVDLVGSKLS